jgi:hypothetical protein
MPEGAPMTEPRRGILADLLMGPNNTYWDLGRVMAALAIAAIVAPSVWNLYLAVQLGIPVEIDKLGIGLAAVVTSAAALIALKDRARPAVAEAPPLTAVNAPGLLARFGAMFRRR